MERQAVKILNWIVALVRRLVKAWNLHVMLANVMAVQKLELHR